MKILLFGLFIYLVYTVLKRMILRPFREGYANMHREKSNRSDNYSNKKEGEVSIDYNPSNKKAKDKGIGEYVDYEEVD